MFENFKQMPLFLKLFTIVMTYSVFRMILGIVSGKYISVEYFGVTFPTIISYAHYVVTIGLAYIIFFKRSSSLLQKYVLFNYVFVAIFSLNLLYMLIVSPVHLLFEQVFIGGVIIFSALFTFLFNRYLLQQKKYFNRV